PNTIVVNVVGEVTKPGAIPVPPNTPLNQAVLAAGGFNNRARKSTVELIRLNPNGSVIRRTVSVDLAQGINEDTNPTLRNNDVVVVNRSTIARVSDTLSTVLTPIGSFFSFFNFLRIFQ
ncbi:MAG TPA: SLBB domain-containing protein, partial [Leptolyngbyaceae cyanobacterium]